MKQMRITKQLGENYVNVQDLIEFLEDDVKKYRNRNAEKYVANLVRRMSNSETFKK